MLCVSCFNFVLCWTKRMRDREAGIKQVEKVDTSLIEHELERMY